MSILIERSFLRLRELRVGLAQDAQDNPWASLPEDKNYTGSPPTDSASSSPGGLLGILLEGLSDAFSGGTQIDSIGSADDDTHSVDEASQLRAPIPLPEGLPFKTAESMDQAHDVQDASILHTMSTVKETLEKSSTNVVNLGAKMQELTDSLASHTIADPVKQDYNSYQSLTSLSSPLKLKLDVLELERVSLSIPVLSKSIDWSKLTSLTILGCRHHDQLWKALRKRFSPRQHLGLPSSLPKSPLKSPRTPSTPRFASTFQDYPLKLKRLHTDSVSTALITFLKETLAPDTLEWLFLQENRNYTSSVTIDQIYRGPLRRHRASLKKLLIDRGERNDGDGAPGGGGPSARNRKWALNREVLTFILSGRMSYLRELAVAIDYKDWHFFLQRLPCIPHLRSLYISHVSEHVHGRNLDSRELALQVLDVVALRPELELCYLGIQTKCFEILEYAAGHKPSVSDLASASHGSGVGGDSEDDSENEGGGHYSSSEHGGDEMGSEVSSTREEEGESEEDEERDGETDRFTSRKSKVFKLREILFYDDKVSIFKARHGRL
jgi:hypothetical protein